MLLALNIRGQTCQISLRQDSLSPGNTVPSKTQIKFPLKNPWWFLSSLPSLIPYKFGRIGFYLFLKKKKTSRCLLSRKTHLRKRIPDNPSFLLDLLTESINLESCENENASQKHICSFQEQITIRKVSEFFFSPKESTLRVSYNLETTVSILYQKRCPTHTTDTRSINYLESESILNRILWLNLPNWS